MEHKNGEYSDLTPQYSPYNVDNPVNITEIE